MTRRTFATTVLIAFALAAASSVYPATIDVGRGPVDVIVPVSYDESQPVPLVVLIHGYTGTGKGQDSLLEVSPLVDDFGFIFVAPDGTKENSEERHQFWSASAACCNFYGSDVDDSAYLRSVIEAVRKEYAVDPRRIFLFGHSNGGFMSHRMAQDHPDLIAAIASLNGVTAQEIKGPRPEHPVSVLQIHGTGDRVILYDGGEIRGTPSPGPSDSVKKWTQYNSGEVKPNLLRERIDIEAKLLGAETWITQYAGGAIELWTIEDGSHVPAFQDDFARRVIEWLYARPKPE